MLQLILTIVKIIGIILAALLGILLAVILAVLFVPIGYDARIDNKKDIIVNANGWWLFHALHISFDMEGIPSEEKGNAPVIKLRILGIPILDTSKKKEEKGKSVEKAADFEKQKVKEVQSISEKPETESKEKDEETIVELPKQEPQLTVQEVSLKEENVTKEAPAVKDAVLKETSVEKKESKKAEAAKTGKSAGKASKTVEKKKENVPKVSIADKIRNFVDGIKKKLQNISDKKQRLQTKVNLVKAFIQNEENIKGIKKIFHSIKKILKRLFPKKIKGHVMFGMNDPCTTGQALGVLAMFYPYYGKSLVIEPDFTKQVLVADVYLKGYIQIVTLCIIAIKLIIDANFRKLIKNFKRLREEDKNGRK